MSMHVFTIILTALLTSVLTIALAWLVFDRLLKTKLAKRIDMAADGLGERFKRQVCEGVREGIDKGLADLPERATKSVARGGLDILEDNLNLLFRGEQEKE